MPLDVDPEGYSAPVPFLPGSLLSVGPRHEQLFSTIYFSPHDLLPKVYGANGNGQSPMEL